jgi:GT2 family glycosyltransferase
MLDAPKQNDLPLVNCVVLNYRSAAQTIECVERLQASTYGNLQIIVVDNLSPDDSVPVLSKELHRVTLIAHDRNLGYGDGNNQGIRAAIASGADFVWIVTPDVRVASDTLSELVACMKEEPKLGICGPIIQAGDLQVKASTVRRDLGYFPAHVIRREGEEVQRMMPTDYVDGCATLLRRAMLEQIGLLRDDFFLYFDETEFCLRAADAGWLVRVCGNAIVQTRPMTEERNNREYYMVRNSIALARTQKRYVLRTVLRGMIMPIADLVKLRLRVFPRRCRDAARGIYAGLTMSLREPPRLDS